MNDAESSESFMSALAAFSKSLSKSEIPFLTQDQKRDILYNNAARFLRLTEEEIAAHHNR
jgi:predicted TIM-barrel fold metal-dependent hydrolase